MPRTEEEKMDYANMLDKLASEYPELEESAMQLSSEIEDIMPMGDDMMEDDPDYEHIHAMLNSGDHESEVFIEHAQLHTPIFQEIPYEIDETWQHGAVIGGMAFRDRRQVARSYKLATDQLVALALTKHEPHELDFPILFLYRHTVELYLKSALAKPPKHHDLGELSRLLESEGGGQIPGWMRDRLRDFHEIDRRSSIFRYADPGPPGELWIDFHQLQAVIDKLVEAFEAYLASRAVGP
ncbi:MAG: hypothetical protein IIC60_12025 [Proteobacteria bacterium]|nr:hypothetical protein [Pseudomonadota bacterium]